MCILYSCLKFQVLLTVSVKYSVLGFDPLFSAEYPYTLTQMMDVVFPSETSVNLSRLHDVTSRKTVVFGLCLFLPFVLQLYLTHFNFQGSLNI